MVNYVQIKLNHTNLTIDEKLQVQTAHMAPYLTWAETRFITFFFFGKRSPVQATTAFYNVLLLYDLISCLIWICFRSTQAPQPPSVFGSMACRFTIFVRALSRFCCCFCWVYKTRGSDFYWLNFSFHVHLNLNWNNYAKAKCFKHRTWVSVAH